MKISLKSALSALSLGVMTLTSVPALAQPREHRENAREYRKDMREARRDYRKDNREARRDYRKDVREARRDWRDDRRDNGRRNGYWKRPGKVVYGYDWNRPDRRYGSRRISFSTVRHNSDRLNALVTLVTLPRILRRGEHAVLFRSCNVHARSCV